MSLIISLLLLVFFIYCNWTLVGKTGNSAWLSLLSIIPFVNVVLWLYFVDSEWPIEKELARYKERFGELPPEGTGDDMSVPITCLQCRATIPADSAVCPACGWSYAEDGAAGTERRT